MSSLLFLGKEQGSSPKDKTMFKCHEKNPKGEGFRIRLYFRESFVDKKNGGKNNGWKTTNKRDTISSRFIFSSKQEAERHLVTFISAIEKCTSHAAAMKCASDFKIPDLSIDGNASDGMSEENNFHSPSAKAPKRPLTPVSDEQTNASGDASEKTYSVDGMDSPLTLGSLMAVDDLRSPSSKRVRLTDLEEIDSIDANNGFDDRSHFEDARKRRIDMEAKEKAKLEKEFLSYYPDLASSMGNAEMLQRAFVLRGKKQAKVDKQKRKRELKRRTTKAM